VHPRHALILPFALLALASATAQPPQAPAPQPREAGLMAPPADYREWIYLSSGFDMSYAPAAAQSEHPEFDNVFVDPVAWRAFKATGHWPDGTKFVLELREATGADALLKAGRYQSDAVTGIEMHVRDDRRFEGGWAFFSFEGTAAAAPLPRSERCYACHEAHGAVDTTFTQFYPVAKAIARREGTYRPRPVAPESTASPAEGSP
jgi:hypothetical protein